MPTCIPLFKTNTRLYCCLFPSVLNFYRMKIYPRSQSRDWLALESSVENVKLLTGGRKSTTRTAAWYAILASILRYSILTRLTLSNLVSVSLWIESLRRAWQLKTTLIKMYIALSTGLLTLQSLPRSSFLLGERNDKKKKYVLKRSELLPVVSRSESDILRPGFCTVCKDGCYFAVGGRKMRFLKDRFDFGGAREGMMTR